MKKTHKLWPVSYVNDKGEQVDTLYSFDPSGVQPGYWVGEPIKLEVEHPSDMADDARIAKILELREKLKKLEAGL